jgi:Cof subfamily protein (haloacid dehalogenase superfamily)
MVNIKMIVTDLDNTLLRKDKTISQYSRAVFRSCIEHGVIVVFATARPERATRQWQIDKEAIYVISNNGATVSKGGNEILNIPISESTKQEVLRRFADDENIIGLTVETGDFLYTREDHSNWPMRGDDGGWNPIQYDFLVPPPEDICKLSVECKIPEILSSILSNFSELQVFPNNGEHWHQITHKTATKLNAITYLSNMTGIAMRDILAFGDDYNDVEMLKGCGVGVAVGNAVADAKQAADFICDTNDNDGVARFLEKNLLFEQRGAI